MPYKWKRHERRAASIAQAQATVMRLQQQEQPMEDHSSEQEDERGHPLYPYHRHHHRSSSYRSSGGSGGAVWSISVPANSGASWCCMMMLLFTFSMLSMLLLEIQYHGGRLPWDPELQNHHHDTSAIHHFQRKREFMRIESTSSSSSGAGDGNGSEDEDTVANDDMQQQQWHTPGHMAWEDDVFKADGTTITKEHNSKSLKYLIQNSQQQKQQEKERRKKRKLKKQTDEQQRWHNHNGADKADAEKQSSASSLFRRIRNGIFFGSDDPKQDVAATDTVSTGTDETKATVGHSNEVKTDDQGQPALASEGKKEEIAVDGDQMTKKKGPKGGISSTGGDVVTRNERPTTTQAPPVGITTVSSDLHRKEKPTVPQKPFPPPPPNAAAGAGNSEGSGATKKIKQLVEGLPPRQPHQQPQQQNHLPRNRDAFKVQKYLRPPPVLKKKKKKVMKRKKHL